MGLPGEKHVPLQHCPPHVPHGLAWDIFPVVFSELLTFDSFFEMFTQNSCGHILVLIESSLRRDRT